MGVSIKFLQLLVLAIVSVSSAFTLTVPNIPKHATHNVRTIANKVKVETYHPASTYEASRIVPKSMNLRSHSQTFGAGIEHPLRKRGASLKECSEAFIASHLGVDESATIYTSGFAAEVASHAYAKQVIDGIPVANAVANVAFNSDDKVVALGSSFIKPSQVASFTPSVSFEEAKNTAEAALDGTYLDEIPSTIEYFAKEDGSVVLVHILQVGNEKAGTWYNAFVDAHTNTLVSVTDYVSHASYLVLPLEKQTLLQGFETVVDPADLESSPLGWHADGTTNTTDTSGNNVFVFSNSDGTTTPQSSSPLVFNYPHDASASPKTPANLDAARVNAFYIINTIHDIAYRYGFTEAAFNFQNNNFGLGGKAGDRVRTSIQDSLTTDNSAFVTFPDGQQGLMYMFLYTATEPNRDAALENDILVHEMGHGITRRMTGGGTSACLGATEGAGMGEGWSDAIAEWTEHTSAAVPDYVLGQYVTNSSAGTRRYPYSTSAAVNPLTYASVGVEDEVHNIGEVWANMLHNVYAALVGAHGWAADFRTNPDGTEGNVVFMRLLIDALPLQPCDPTFVTARDAWLQADVNRYDGAHRCLLWKAFASRGLGVDAANYVDDATIPSDC
ncbi:Fungalysin metallopeptidase-domain-containing protein [Mycena crocata]|nr:Fungalysin metallopeptidase-domain-containing protein [Mycena crocata]